MQTGKLLLWQQCRKLKGESCSSGSSLYPKWQNPKSRTENDIWWLNSRFINDSKSKTCLASVGNVYVSGNTIHAFNDDQISYQKIVDIRLEVVNLSRGCVLI